MKPFNFKCTGCGKCCLKITPQSYIKTTEEDLERISKFIGREIKSINWVDWRCEFLGRNNRCKIEKVKPEYCAKWPHVPDVVLDRRMLKIADMLCEGINLEK